MLTTILDMRPMGCTLACFSSCSCTGDHPKVGFPRVRLLGQDVYFWSEIQNNRINLIISDMDIHPHLLSCLPLLQREFYSPVVARSIIQFLWPTGIRLPVYLYPGESNKLHYYLTGKIYPACYCCICVPPSCKTNKKPAGFKNIWENGRMKKTISPAENVISFC